MIDREILKKIRKIDIHSKRLVNTGLAGSYHSVFKGRGMSFDEVRPYQPGDEIRFIDWNVSARMDEVFVKVFVEERELTLMLAVDLSASLDFSTQEQSKREIIAELAAVVAFSAIKNNDRVGLLLYSDKVEKYIAPKKGKKHVLRVISEILSSKNHARICRPELPFEFLGGMKKEHSVSFIFSDFIDDRRVDRKTAIEGMIDPNFEKWLRIASRRHDLIPVCVQDPAEVNGFSFGHSRVEDSESALGLDFLWNRKSQRAFQELSARRKEALSRLYRKLNIDNLDIRSDRPHIPELVKFFKMREGRLR